MTVPEQAGYRARHATSSARKLPPDMAKCTFKKGAKAEWVRGWNRADGEIAAGRKTEVHDAPAQ